MSDAPKTSRKLRSITSTFSLRDVAVVAVAAFTAAGPFFAYDTRISVVEATVEKIEEADAETRQTVNEVEQKLDEHLKDYREEKLAIEDHMKNDHAAPPLPPLPANK